MQRRELEKEDRKKEEAGTMKVYMLSTGKQENYQIQGIYLKKELALKDKEKLNESWSAQHYPDLYGANEPIEFEVIE